MKWLKWIGAFLLISLISDLGKMYFTHSMSAIDKSMNKVVAEISPKLPMNNDIGLTVTRVTYNSPIMRQYFSIPKGVDPERYYKKQLVDAACNDKTLWMFKKGLRIENIFQEEKDPNSTALDLSVDKTIVIDDKQCQRKEPTFTAVQMDKNTPTGFAPQTHRAYEAPAVTAPAASPSDTTAASY